MLSRLVAIATLMTAAACGGPVQTTGAAATLRAPCPEGQYRSGSRCLPHRDISKTLKQASKEMKDFKVEAALKRLEATTKAKPLAWADHVRLYQQLGIAYGFLNRAKESERAFAKLLALDPSHIINYELGPKATFPFSEARKLADKRGAAQIQVSWPRHLRVSRPVPVELEVVHDPDAMLRRASLHVRRKGERAFRSVDVRLPKAGKYRKLLLPATNSRKPEVLQLYVTAFDQHDNEVLLWASPERPREVPLRYQPATPWYRKWWVWAAIGGAVTATTATVVYIGTREPSDNIGGSFGF